MSWDFIDNWFSLLCCDIDYVHFCRYKYGYEDVTDHPNEYQHEIRPLIKQSVSWKGCHGQLIEWYHTICPPTQCLKADSIDSKSPESGCVAYSMTRCNLWNNYLNIRAVCILQYRNRYYMPPNTPITINITSREFKWIVVPQGNDVEHENSPTNTSTYECLQCGSIVESESHPGTCDCDGDFQNRAKSLE